MVAVAKEKALAHRFDLGIEKFERLLVGELHRAVLQTAHAFKHLVGCL